MVMKWKRLHKEAQAPERQTPGSAGYDLCACIQDPAVIGPGDTGVFPTGLALEIPEGHVGLVFCRSGLGVKHGISLPNCVGVIDSDYRGEIMVGLYNSGESEYTVQPADRIAQLMVVPVVQAQIQMVDELDETQRGAGGFGSTGK